MLEGDDLREMLSGITPLKTNKQTNKHQAYQNPENSAYAWIFFLYRLFRLQGEKKILTLTSLGKTG